MPRGGNVGGLIGAIDGAIIGHIVGGQIGGKSIELLHKGCIWPFTHWQIHSALTGLVKAAKATKAAKAVFFLIAMILRCNHRAIIPPSLVRQLVNVVFEKFAAHRLRDTKNI